MVAFADRRGCPQVPRVMMNRVVLILLMLAVALIAELLSAEPEDPQARFHVFFYVDPSTKRVTCRAIDEFVGQVEEEP